MEQDSEVWDPGHGAKNTQIRWEACGGLECWLAPGGQGGTSSTTPLPGLGENMLRSFVLLVEPESVWEETGAQ